MTDELANVVTQGDTDNKGIDWMRVHTIESKRLAGVVDLLYIIMKLTSTCIK